MTSSISTVACQDNQQYRCCLSSLWYTVNRMYLKRHVQLKSLLDQKSLFLFGARATGKTSMIKHQLKNEVFLIDLLRGDLYLRLKARPWELEEMISIQSQQVIVIDEIQRIPALLQEVHRLIEAKQYRFL